MYLLVLVLEYAQRFTSSVYYTVRLSVLWLCVHGTALVCHPRPHFV